MKIKFKNLLKGTCLLASPLLLSLSSQAQIVSTYAGTGTAGMANGSLLQSSFKNPSGMAIAANGDLYVADTNGFHKGTPLINNFRCLLTVHYVSSKPKNKFLRDKFIY